VFDRILPVMPSCWAVPWNGVAFAFFCKGFMSSFAKKVKSEIIKLITPGDKVLVAVSGGADSLALLYILERFSKELGYELFVAHLNHFTRGKESDADAIFVEKEANKLSLPFFIDKIDVKKSALKSSFQESARILRYQFLECVLMSIKGNKIALGHTADDRIETVLMNLLRGSGLRGLAGIPEVRGCLVRPILTCTRSEIEDFLDGQNLIYRTDSSNNEKKYLRNKIRHEVIPFLKTFNPDISGNLLGLAEIARGEEEWMSKKTLELYSQLVTTDNGDLCFEITKFENQPLAMKRRLIRESFYCLNGSLREITSLHVQQVVSLFSRARVGCWLKLPGNIRVVCGYDTVCFSLSDDSTSIEIDKKIKRLEIPGVTSLLQIGIQFQARLVEPLLPKHVDHKQAYLDFEKTGSNIQVRFFQPGDSFVPLGMSGHKKVKSYFIDQKVPREQRSLIPILTNSHDDIIWVYGERISDSFRIDENTKKVLFIEGKRL
jgi:tRNA(Ile)-lysidine synthase